jgi:hypothetical protein
MQQEQITDFHFSYLDVYRHFHAGSERFTGGDALITAIIDEGWSVSHVVGLEERWRSGGHGTPIYYFELERDGQTMTMAVIGNPYVRRIIRQLQVTLVPVPLPR